jgi:hypothetical protein
MPAGSLVVTILPTTAVVAWAWYPEPSRWATASPPSRRACDGTGAGLAPPAERAPPTRRTARDARRSNRRRVDQLIVVVGTVSLDDRRSRRNVLSMVALVLCIYVAPWLT